MVEPATQVPEQDALMDHTVNANFSSAKAQAALKDLSKHFTLKPGVRTGNQSSIMPPQMRCIPLLSWHHAEDYKHICLHVCFHGANSVSLGHCKLSLS